MYQPIPKTIQEIEYMATSMIWFETQRETINYASYSSGKISSHLTHIY